MTQINQQINEAKKVLNNAPAGFNEKKHEPLFKKLYKTEIRKNMMELFKYRNVEMIPKIEKITISAAISNLRHQPEVIYKMYNSLYLMTGVKPVYTKASRSISQFKLHEGNIVGCKVILRKNEAFEFMERLVHIYLPNIKGFRGISASSINKSSISIGIKDAHIIREVSPYIKLLQFGFTITIDVLSHINSSEETFELLKQFKLPIRKDL